MKSFLKFLITIFVLGLICYLVYYVVNDYKNIDNGIYEISGEILSGDSGEIFDYDGSGEDIEEISGEVSGEISINLKDEINLKVMEIESGEDITILDSELESNVLGVDAKDFMDYFNVSTLSVSVNLKNGKVEIIPYNDFLSNQVFYFDEQGMLILYEKVSTTVGGSSKYYFDNNVNFDIEHNYEEPSLEIINEDSSDILFRARYMYTKFLEK